MNLNLKMVGRRYVKWEWIGSDLVKKNQRNNGWMMVSVLTVWRLFWESVLGFFWMESQPRRCVGWSYEGIYSAHLSLRASRSFWFPLCSRIASKFWTKGQDQMSHGLGAIRKHKVRRERAEGRSIRRVVKDKFNYKIVFFHEAYYKSAILIQMKGEDCI